MSTKRPICAGYIGYEEIIITCIGSPLQVENENGYIIEPSPAPTEIRSAREAAGLSQTAAAARIWYKLRTWQQWESGKREMHPALWWAWREIGIKKGIR